MSARITYSHALLPSSVNMMYAEAGETSLPTLLFLHGFPTSSFQFRNLIPLLSDKYHVVAPDLPGFGQTVLPASFHLTFDSIADSIAQLLDQLGIDEYAVYVFDYGAPTAWRLALSRPDSTRAIMAQNGNAYEEGLGEWWDGLKGWWASGEEFGPIREAVRPALSLDNVKRQYTFGVPDELVSRIDPSAWTLDYLHNIKGHEDRQLDLFYDYRTNLALYPRLHEWFRRSQVPLLAVWGKNDQIFPGDTSGTAFIRDLPDATVHMLDGGHFLLETHLMETSDLIKEFLGRITW